MKKIESHPHREALQADLQQKSVYNLFSDISKAMIREMGNVELFELWEKIQKCNAQNAFFYWKQGVIYCTCGHLLKENESSDNVLQWRLVVLNPELRSSRMERLLCARHGKTGVQKEHFVANDARRRCLKKKFRLNSRSASNEIQHVVIRNSKLVGPRRECIEIGWIGTREPLLLPILLRNTKEKLENLTEQIRQICTDETPIRLPRSTNKYAPSRPWIWRKSDLNQFLFINTKGGIRRLLPVPHGGSGMKTYGAHKYFCEKKCSKINYSWQQSAATDKGVWTVHPHTSHFLAFVRTHDSVPRDIGSTCSAHRVIHVSCGCASWFSSTLHFALFTVSLIFLLILLIFIFIFHVGRFGEKYPCALPRRVRHFGRQHPSHTSWAHSLRRLLHLRDPLKSSSRSPPPTAGPRTCTSGKSVTTPSAERYLHLFIQERKEPPSRRQAYHLSSQSFFRTHKYGETRYTKLVPSQKRKSGRDMGKRKNQDSPWTTKRANSRWSQNWDPGLTSGCRWSDKCFLVHVRKLHIPPSRWTQSQALLAERRIYSLFH